MTPAFVFLLARCTAIAALPAPGDEGTSAVGRQSRLDGESSDDAAKETMPPALPLPLPPFVAVRDVVEACEPSLLFDSGFRVCAWVYFKAALEAVGSC